MGDPQRRFLVLSGPFGCGCMVLVGGLAAVVLYFAFDVSLWWCAAVLVAAYLFGAAFGRWVSGWSETVIELTASEVRLVRPDRVRVRSAGDLRWIGVIHTDDGGLHTTTLEVAFPDSTIRVTDQQNLGLAESVAGVVGRAIPISVICTQRADGA